MSEFRYWTLPIFTWIGQNVVLFFGIIALIFVAVLVIDNRLVGGPIYDRVLYNIKSLLLITAFLILGGGVVYFGLPHAIDHVRIATSSVETVGTVLLSEPFRERRGSRKRRRWVEGFDITIEFFDPYLGKIKDTFENRTDIARGERVVIYHVPSTHITSPNDKFDIWTVAFPMFGLGLFIMGIVRVWGLLTKKVE